MSSTDFQFGKTDLSSRSRLPIQIERILLEKHASFSGRLAATREAATHFCVKKICAPKIRGVEVEGIKIFKGVPYGANTAGKNRFMPPVDPAKWTGVREALDYGQSAPQTEPGTRRNTSDLAVAGAGLGNEGEDCLVLNIW